jgi:hypothetical protein
MLFSKIITLIAITASSLVGAAPLAKRALSANDQSVLQLATYLEHLEYALYTGGYDNFTDAEYTAAGFPSGYRENIGIIASVSLLSSCYLC